MGTSLEEYLNRTLKDKKFIIYGAGWGCEVFFNYFCRKYKKYPKYILDIDSKKRNTKKFLPSQVKKFPEEVDTKDLSFKVILTLINQKFSSSIESVVNNLREFGFNDILPIFFAKQFLLKHHSELKSLYKLYKEKTNEKDTYDCAIFYPFRMGDFLIFLPYLYVLSLNYKKIFLIISEKIKPLIKLLLDGRFSNIEIAFIDLEKFFIDFFYRAKILRDKQFYNAYFFCDNGMEILISNLRNEIKILNNFYLYNMTEGRLLFPFSQALSTENSLLFYKLKKFSDFIVKEEKMQCYMNYNFSDWLKIFREKFIKKFYKKSKDKYIVIFPDAQDEFKKYPTKKWQKIINYLPQNIKIYQIGLKGIPLEHPNLYDLCGKIPFEKVVKYIVNASMAIGVDTGLTHLAYMAGVPTVCLLGGGHFGYFFPIPELDNYLKIAISEIYKDKYKCFNCAWECKYVNRFEKITPCIETIPEDKVIEKIEKLIFTFKLY